MEKNFDLIYKIYPKKKGRTEAFKRYKLWVTTGKSVNGRRIKLTNKVIWSAVMKYKKEMESKDTDLMYYKDFSTLMGNSLLDYIEGDKND